MNSSDSRAAYLFSKYYNETASQEEIAELFHLLKDASDDELVKFMRAEWDSLHKGQLFDEDRSIDILKRILPERGNRSPEFLSSGKKIRTITLSRFLVAASILIFLCGGLYFMDRTPQKVQPPMAKLKESFQDVPPGGNRAVLTLSDGRTIVLDSLEDGTILKTKNFEIEKTEDGQVTYHAFARNYKNAFSSDMNTISTPRGGEYRVILPDGSKVWLNSASSIKFPAVFRGKTREIELKGEAYFEIAKNAMMPFRVKSKHADVEVLGTHFNVRAYDDEASMKTTLVEGSVKIRTENSTNLLEPGEQAVLEGSEMTIVDDIDVDAEIAWTNGLFQFKDASLKDVMNQAALWYDLEVRYSGPLTRRYFTGKISRNVNVSEFLNMLRYTGVEVTVKGKEVTIGN